MNWKSPLGNDPLLAAALSVCVCAMMWPADVEDPGPFAINPSTIPILSWNPRWGVKADGVTDDSPALSAAIEYARTNRSKRILVQLPTGELCLSNTIAIRNGDQCRGVHLNGYGLNSTLTAAHTNSIIVIEGYNHRFSNMTLKYSTPVHTSIVEPIPATDRKQ